MADDDANTSEPKDEKCVSFTYTTYSSDFHVIDNTNEENISLQEAFRKYREAKQNELRQARMLKKRQELRKADPKKMAALRQKFVNQAKKYYGYPYARKYWPPESPEYKSKLFLDCCGLVRRVMRDLQDDFGFIIGPWNQAYMFDTLPIEVKSEKDMKPGDLVFISATYYNPKSKKQRHNMTHVEIWAGEGIKTIGARWNNGKVKLFDSYKFTAKSYHSETYHFRSLDTWLKGICRSHCSQHSWRRSKYNPSKKSIFSIPDQAEQDEAAGDDNDNVDNFTVRGNTFIDEVTGISKMVKDCKLAGAERPKSDMDLRHVHSDSSLPSAKSHAVEPATFPVIKNNLGEKGKNVSGKKKKKQNERREDDDNGVKEGSASANRSEVETEAVSKPLGQFAISSSLTDLGKKGFYLKDLVDSTKAGSKGEMIDSGEENSEGDDDNDDVQGASGDDSDDDYLSKGSDEDFDDDYFIFVKDENARDVEEDNDVGANDDNDDENGVDDEKVGGVEVSGESEHVTDGSTCNEGERKGEAYNISEECKVIENDEKGAKEISECGEGHVAKEGNDELPEESHNADSGVSEIGETNELKVRDDCIAKKDENAFDDSSGNKSEAELEEINVKEQLERTDSEALVCGENVMGDIMSGLEDESQDSANDCDKDSKMLVKAEADVIKTVNQSSTSSVDFETEHYKACDANTNENANPEITEQVDSNKAQKMKIECVKPSIVTMVTKGGHSSQPHAQSSMQTPILPAENTSSISRPVSSRTTQSSGSNSSCETDYRMNSSRGANK